MKFQVLNTKTGEVLLNFYPPTNINEITPHNKFILLDLGNFIVPSKSKTTYDAKDKIDNDEDEYDKTVEITIIMEESGLYIKSGFSICYIDINAFPKEKLLEVANTTDLVSISHDKEVMKKFENKWIYWYIENQEPRTENVINYLLKDFYKVLNESYKLFANDDDNEDSDDDNANGTNQDNEDNTNSPITRRRKSAFSISLSYPTFQRLNSYNNLLDSNSYNTNSTLGDLQEYYKTKHNYKMNNSSSAISQMRPLGPLTPAMSMSPITNSHDSAPNFNTDLFSPKENRTRNRASSFTNGLFENLKVKLPKEGEDEIIDNLIKIRRNTISQIRGFPYSDVFNSIGTNSDNDNNNNNDNDNDNEMDIDVEREARICKDKNDRRQELEDRFIKVSKKINIQDYNFKFFNKLNEQNELIERKFKFKNIIYQREFEEINNKLKKHKLNSNKMNQIFQKKLKLSNDKLKTNKYSDDNNSDENNSDNNDNNKDVLDYDLELNEPLKWKVLTIFKL
ncbi:unnamed protein product [[Candida] boidinii]|nr:unnamed protein product [[Candida] boidinii]